MGYTSFLMSSHLWFNLYFWVPLHFCVFIQFCGPLHFCGNLQFWRSYLFFDHFPFWNCLHILVHLHFWGCPHYWVNLQFKRLSSFKGTLRKKSNFIADVRLSLNTSFEVWWHNHRNNPKISLGWGMGRLWCSKPKHTLRIKNLQISLKRSDGTKF